MVLIKGVKYACERCIRGHRVTTCSHTDQPLMMIKPKGRPSTTCDLCKELRKNKKALQVLPNGVCTCGRLEKRRQQQKFKEEAKAKAKLLAKENKKKKAAGTGTVLNNAAESPRSLVNGRRGSEISMQSYQTNYSQRKKSITMLKGFNNNQSFQAYPNYAQSDASSINSPTSLDRRNSINAVFLNRNFSDSSNLAGSNTNFLDSGINYNSGKHSGNNHMGKILKDYQGVTSLTSLSSLQSQQSIENGFSSPQSPLRDASQINFITGQPDGNTFDPSLTSPTSANPIKTENNDALLSIDNFLFQNSSQQWLMDNSISPDDNINNQDMGKYNNDNNISSIPQNNAYNGLIQGIPHNQDISKKLQSTPEALNTFIDGSLIPNFQTDVNSLANANIPITKSTTDMKINNVENSTEGNALSNDTLNWFLPPDANNLNSYETNGVNGKEFMKNEVDYLKQLQSVEVLSLTPDFFEMPVSTVSSSANLSNANLSENPLRTNEKGINDIKHNNSTPIPQSIPSEKSMNNGNNFSYQNLQHVTHMPSNYLSLNADTSTGNGNFSIPLQTELDQYSLQSALKTEGEELLNI